jgi:DNA-binding NtrC family response regulator
MMRGGDDLASVAPAPAAGERRIASRRWWAPAAARLAPAARPAATFHGLIGSAPAMQQLFAAIDRFAPHARTTLITGETGTGKAAVARLLYRLGPRRGGAFVPVTCADPAAGVAVDGDAWTHRAADADVTLYFDDVADLPSSGQLRLAQLLTATETNRPGADDVHVIAATAHDLPAAIAGGRFRPDLFYRLGVFALHLPPLRARLVDVPDLATAFLRDIAARLHLPVHGLTAAAVSALQAQPWPGNLRELHNVLERAAVLTDGDVVGERAVRAALVNGAASDAPAATANLPAPTIEASPRLDDAQRVHVRAVLRDARGNETAAAARLGISRRALYRLLDRLGA